MQFNYLYCRGAVQENLVWILLSRKGMKDISLCVRRGKKLKEQAYDTLKGLVLSGKLSPGCLYNEGRLAEALGISRTPVREALLELGSEGLVSFVPGRGIQIIGLTGLDIRDIFEIRRLIEGHIVKEVSTRLSGAELADLAKQQVLLTRNEGYAFIEGDREMHRILSATLRNGRMDAILCNLWSKMQQTALCVIEDRRNNDRIIEEHEAILAALFKRDEGMAHDHLLQHLCNSETRLMAYTVS